MLGHKLYYNLKSYSRWCLELGIVTENDVDVVTIGQYLQPSKKHLPVQRFINPDEFDEYKAVGLELGFRHVESSALVRSSYKAQKHIN